MTNEQSEQRAGPRRLNARAFNDAVRGTVSYADWQAQLDIRPPYALFPYRTANTAPYIRAPPQTTGATTSAVLRGGHRTKYAAYSDHDKTVPLSESPNTSPPRLPGQAYDGIVVRFRPESIPPTTVKGWNFGASYGAVFVCERGGSYPKSLVGEVTKKEDREADRTGSGSSKKTFDKSIVRPNSVDDARRLYVKTNSLVRTNVRAKKVRKTTGAEGGSALFGSTIFRDIWVGSPERLWLYERSERVRKNHRRARDSRRCHELAFKRCPERGLTFCCQPI